MNVVTAILEELIGEEGTGIFVKQLRSGPLYTCRCPQCGTIHGGFRSYAEAQANLKCRMCNRNAVEKLKKDIEKVDEPEPQKDIFQNPLKRNVIGESDEDDLDLKNVSGINPDPEYVAYEIFDGHEYYPVLNTGKIGRQTYTHPDQFSGQWRLMGMSFHQWSTRFTPWPEIRKRLEAGETLVGYVFDFDHGGYRKWGRRAKVYRVNSVNESADLEGDEEDVKAILGDIPMNPLEPIEPGQVTKTVCMNAHYGQEFYSRLEHHANGFPKKVRAMGKCKTWKTRPNEFRLPVKYGLYQSFYITHDNAGDFSTIPYDARGKPV